MQLFYTICVLLVAAIGVNGDETIETASQRRLREQAVQEATRALGGQGRVGVMNATQHPLFEWYVSKVEFGLNLEAAILEWEGVEAPPAETETAPSTRRALQSTRSTKCREPSRGLKATKQTKCRKFKNRAYFGQMIKKVSSITKPDECCTLCGKTNGCVSWTLKPRSAGREKGCFLRKKGPKKTKTMKGYWSGYTVTGKAPAPVPSPPPPEVAYEAPDLPEEVYEAPPLPEVAYEAPDLPEEVYEAPPLPDTGSPSFDDFWDEFYNGGVSLAPEPVNLPKGTGKYRELLELNWKFYEAQRSGPEPEWDRISWRGASHLNDYVVGGTYDAGDFLKLNFPLAASMIHTGHGLVDFKSGCSSSRTPALNNYKWSIKYLLDCLDVENGWYVGQIGDPKIDHNYWGRAEEQPPMKRPALLYKRDSMPASDLYGSVSAALAQAAVVFEEAGDVAFAEACLEGALELYRWGDGRPGKYSDYYKEQTKIYKSTGGDDSMATAAGWLYRKTKDPVWLEKAFSYFSYDKADVYCGWDSLWGSHVSHMISLADRGIQVPGINEYRRWSTNKYWRAWLQADGFQSIIKTPKGLHYPKWNAWANLAFSTTSASHALIQAKYTKDSTLKTRLMNYARGQADYAIGGNGLRSYVIGWGANWPKFAHHAGASCPSSGPCGQAAFTSQQPNPNGPNGAMVAGPGGVRKSRSDPDGAYNDRRNDYVTNEVAVDYNSGLSTLFCGLIELF